MSLRVDTYELKMTVEVHDIPALYKKAFAAAIASGETEESARNMLGTGETEDDTDVGACLVMLIDPGASPDGTEIQHTYTEWTGSRGGDDDDAEPTDFDEHQPTELTEWLDYDPEC